MAGDRARTWFIAVAALGFVIGACSSGDDPISAGGDTGTSDEISADTSADLSTGAAESSVADGSTTAAADDESPLGSTVVATEPIRDDALPGEAFDLFPYADAEMTVVGVASDDVLNVRVGPGTEYRIATTLDPMSVGEAIATGRNRSVDSGIWAEVRVADTVGWANTQYLLQSGRVDDDTAALYPMPEQRPVDASLAAIGRSVAEEYASIGPTSTIVLVDGPNEGDLASVTLDVIGLGDDSVGGYRVTVFAERFQGGYQVRTVETTTLCSRGVTDGVCL